MQSIRLDSVRRLHTLYYSQFESDAVKIGFGICEQTRGGLSHGASRTDRYERHRVFFDAAAADRVDILKQAPAEVLQAWLGPQNLLHRAAQHGSLQALNYLLDNGLPIDQGTLRGGVTPLLYAVRCGHTEVVEHLLQRGADPNISVALTDPVYPGVTCLHWAVESQNAALTQTLLQHRAAPDTPDGRGVTARQLAEPALSALFPPEPAARLGWLSGTIHLHDMPEVIDVAVNLNLFRTPSPQAPPPFEGQPPPEYYLDSLEVKGFDQQCPLEFRLQRPEGYYHLDVGVMALRRAGNGSLFCQIEHRFPLPRPVQIAENQPQQEVTLDLFWPDMPLEELGHYGTVDPDGKFHSAD